MEWAQLFKGSNYIGFCFSGGHYYALHLHDLFDSHSLEASWAPGMWQ